MAVGGASGDVIHHIALSMPTGNGGAIYRGQDGALMYSRSNDGGASFAVQNQLLAPFDSTQSVGIGGDAYAIDARGNVVAIVLGGFGEDVVLAKSTDGGMNWTKTIVQDFAITPYNNEITDINNDGIADTAATNDGSMAVLIDNNDKVHVWFGDMRILNEDGVNTSYFPGTATMSYWNETMTAPEVVAGAEDLNANGTLDITDFGTYQISLVSQPTAGIDAMGNIYVAFSAIMEGTNDGTDKSFRNIYAMMTTDGGATWTTPHNIAQDLFSEKVYPSMARTVDSKLRITYQVDPIAGHGISTTTSPDPDNANVTHDIVYAEVPVADLAVGIHENNVNITTLEVYPNPANTTATVSVYLKKAQPVTISMFNSIGQMVSTQTSALSQGTNVVDLNVAGLAAGIYFVNVQEGTSMISKKLIVE
jgi:hypothetical protein